MRGKITIAALTGVVALSTVVASAPIYAAEINQDDKSINNENSRTANIIYVEDGEGLEGSGNGTEGSPYKNIRTALKYIKDGDILKLNGSVVYTKYETHTDKSPLPLLIDKKITIEGVSESDSLALRSAVQLGADVTFRNMRLELMPQVSLDMESSGIGSGALGGVLPRASTIFAAGHTLTLDNVNTKVGSNINQDNHRPYISGGVYKDQYLDKMGDKAVINIVNPNAETKIAAIYAGDYWNDRNMEVEINLDGKLIDTTLYTGGADGNILTGDVAVNITGESGSLGSNITGFDQSYHEGNVYVNLADGYCTTNLSLEGIDQLTLEEGCKVAPSYEKNLSTNEIITDCKFDVKDVVLNKDAVIDFRNMMSTPVIRGSFTGEDTENASECGSILLKNSQTLEIKGLVTGLTKLNYNNGGYVEKFADKHEYIIADLNSTGNFTIENTNYADEFKVKVNKNINDNTMSWSTVKVDDTEQIFNDLRWVGGDDKIVNPDMDKVYCLPIEFIDKNNNPYKPKPLDLLNDFIYILEKPNGDKIDILDVDVDDFDVFACFNEDNMYSSDVSEMNQLELTFYNPDNMYGEINLTVTHIDSGKEFKKTIYVVDKDDEVIIPSIPGDGNIIETPDVDIPEIGGGTTDPEVEIPGNGGTIPDIDGQENGNGETIPDGNEHGNEDGQVTPDINKPGSNEGTASPNPETGKPDDENIQPPVNEDNSNIDKPEEDKDKEDTENNGQVNPEISRPGDGTDSDVSIPVEVNKDLLQEYYNGCIKKGYSKKEYTQSSFTKYEKALTAAEKMLNNKNAKQIEVDTALKNLKNAVSGLVIANSTSSSGGGSSSGSSGGSSSGSSGGSSSGSSGSGSSSSSSGSGSSSNLSSENETSQSNDNEQHNKVDSNMSSSYNSNKKGEWKLKDEKWYYIFEDGTNAVGWHKDNDGKWYHLKQTGIMTTGWHKDESDGKWYHLEQSGAMTIGWFKDNNGIWYHLGESGAMTTGWFKDSNGTWYYLNNDGSMAANTTVDGYYVDNSGAWVR